MPMTIGPPQTPAKSFSFHAHPAPKASDVTIIECHGLLYVGDAEAAFKAEIESQLSSGFKKIVLNMSDVTQMDSAGMGQLVQSCKEVMSHGGTLVISSPSDRAARKLDITGLGGFIHRYGSDAAAVTALSPQPNA